MLLKLSSIYGDGNHQSYMEKWKKCMDEAYKIVRENAHKADSKVRVQS